MKKTLSIILAAVMLITSLSVFTVAEAASNPTISAESTTVQAGETMELNLSISNNPGMSGLVVTLRYDRDVFTLESAENGDLFDSLTYATNFAWDNSANVMQDGVLATVVFSVADDAATDDYTIEVVVRECVNMDLDDVDCDASNGTVHVDAKPIAATGVSLNTETLSLMTGDSETLVANVEPADATNKAVTWESSDISVATVDENGKVTAVKEGSATITVRTADGGFTDTCTVTVDCSHLSTTVVPAEPSTCIKHGHAEYTVCNDCGAVVAGSDAELPLAPHSYVENAEEEYLVSAATCVDRAVYYESCSVCGAAGTETFEYGDVDLSNHVGETYLVGQKDATCIETGYTGDVYCSSCDNMISAGTETPLAAHTYGEWVETTKPTCTEPGEETRTCAVCGNFETRPVAATGHTPGEWTTTIEPTCTEEGEREAFCEECGVRFTEPVPATGHTAGEWEITTPATCTEDGVRTTTCTVCGVEYTEVIPATGHQYGAWTVVKEATETEEGLRERVCSVCGEKESEVIPKLAAEETETTETTTSSTNGTTSSNTDTKSPKTGLETGLVIFAVIGATATVVVVFTVSRKKKSLNK